MEGRENVGAGVTVIGAEAPSNYHVAARTENPIPVAGAPTVVGFSMTAGVAGTMEKKKRGRPRKYGPDGSLSRSLSPTPISSSSAPPPSTGGLLVPKRGRGKPIILKNKQHHGVGLENSGKSEASTAGTNFMPHLITVKEGEDITMKIISFTQQGPRVVFILSANGSISNVTLKQDDSSGATLTYEGKFELINLQGSFTPLDVGASKGGSSGCLSVTLATSNGSVIGGTLAGLLIAGGPVRVLVGSFLPSGYEEHKPKKRKMNYSLATDVPASTDATPASIEKEYYFSHEKNNSADPKSNPASSATQPQNWASMETTPDSRRSTADINISLQGE